MSNQPLAILGGLSAERFLADHWQKRPLLIRNAWPDFADPLSPEELAGLACEEPVEARLVMERGGAKPWALRYGPFSEADFLRLPESHWTLLVQDAEKHLPELYALLEPFRFIPDWRIDDLMISYAPCYGSVGPHVDNYDVFLLQGLGRRRWGISTASVAPHNVLPDTELSILREFKPEREWTLEPGDLLYLPPRVAHYGVALEPCLTYSIGFRAPSHHDLVSHFTDYLLGRIEDEDRYADPDLTPQDDPGALSDTALSKITAVLRQKLTLDDALLEDWFGRYATEPLAAFPPEPPTEPLTEELLRSHLGNGGELERSPGARLAYRDSGRGGRTLFAGGEAFSVTADIGFLAPLLCRHRVLKPALLGPVMDHPPAVGLLLELINSGHLVIYEYE
jgi:50S ribosomal protein L16 3-hydroxylase